MDAGSVAVLEETLDATAKASELAMKSRLEIICPLGI
jgi:hypothetical protein